MIPRIEGVVSGEWSNWTWDSMLIEGSNCREIIDNMVDMAHFFYIHYAFPTYFKNVFEGHIATQYLNTKGRPDIGHGVELRRRGQPAAVGGLLLRAVVHDQQAAATRTRASRSRPC